MPETGKRVSWVELYLDLVFVLAVGELAHLIVATPHRSTVWITLGLFLPLWWTWVGFAVLYNRHGSEDSGLQRILFLGASIPVGVAAVAVEPASHGHSTAFVISLAVTRVILTVAYAHDEEPGSSAGDVLRIRTSRASTISALLFVASIWVPSPVRYLLWAVAILQESRVMLTRDRDAAELARRTHSFAAMTPREPGEALDAHHFAERFGLFIIILLGEVVVEAGQAAASGHVETTSGWSALVAAMLLAAALWWTYFDSVVELNLRVLELSGGSPTAARAIFAIGHMIPAFALLMAAAGTGLLLEHDPPKIAYWLLGIGAALYLTGSRAFLRIGPRNRRVLRLALGVALFLAGLLHRVLGPHAYVWLIAVWVAACAALSTGAEGPPAAEPAREAELPPELETPPAAAESHDDD
jgi:low temperature requirement protein LtrA